VQYRIEAWPSIGHPASGEERIIMPDSQVTDYAILAESTLILR
jgi:hypothetical protein